MRLVVLETHHDTLDMGIVLGPRWEGAIVSPQRRRIMILNIVWDNDST
jgi:hypothetical protein